MGRAGVRIDVGRRWLLRSGTDDELSQTGVQLRALRPPAVHETETGGGGVRMCRVSPHRPPLLLLATDDGLAPVWSLGEPDPAPIQSV